MNVVLVLYAVALLKTCSYLKASVSSGEGTADSRILSRSTSGDRGIPVATSAAARLGDEEDLNVMKSISLLLELSRYNLDLEFSSCSSRQLLTSFVLLHL